MADAREEIVGNSPDLYVHALGSLTNGVVGGTGGCSDRQECVFRMGTRPMPPRLSIVTFMALGCISLFSAVAHGIPPNSARISPDLAAALAANDIDKVAEGFRIQHPRHTAVLTPDGLDFVPRQGGLQWHWRLVSIGWQGEPAREQTLKDGCEAFETESGVLPVMSERGTVRYDRGGLIEQYVVRPNSLEQQFIIPEPMGTAGKALVIEGEVSSGGQFEEGTGGWLWRTPDGVVSLGNVSVYDASGKKLPARMTVTDCRTLIEVDGAALLTAQYPVTIDPDVGTNDFRLSDMGPNSNGNYDATYPAVAYNTTNNEYLVVWIGDDNTAPLVDNEYEIFGQRIDAATGAEVGTNDFRISDMGTDGNTSFTVQTPSVAYNSTNNEYLVVWVGDDNAAPLVDNEYEVFGQRIDGATGAEVGTNDFRISDVGPDGNTAYIALTPDVAYNSVNNEYLVVWAADDYPTVLNDEYEIFAQRINGATGAEVGTNDFRISDVGPTGSASYDAANPSVAYNSANNEYLVVWSGDDYPTVLNDENEIFAQRINGATGAEVGTNDFRISDMGPVGNANYDATYPDVAYNSTNDEYLVIWVGDDNTAPLVDNDNEVFGQRVSGATGAEVGTNDFRISAMGPDGDVNYPVTMPRVTYCTAKNEYFVVWSGDDDTLPLINNEYEIFGQRLDAATGTEIGIDDLRISDMGPDGNVNFGATNPHVAYNSVNNEYLVVWTADDNTVPLVDGENEIFGQRRTPNEAPTDITVNPGSLPEHEPAGTVASVLSTTDSDPGDTHTYTLVAGTGDTDNASFTIVGNELRSALEFNYETKNSYSIRLQTDDGNGETYQEAVTIAVTNINEAPTDISLSATSVAENVPIGTLVGLISTVDADLGEAHTYTLVTGAGDTDNNLFTIVGNQLRVVSALNYEAQNSCSIRLQTDDGNGGTFQKVFTISVIDVNEAPTNISILFMGITEEMPIGSVVGTLSASDQDPADTHTYSLVAGSGDTDNGSFTVVGNELRSAVVFDFEVQSSFRVRLQADDGHGGVYQESLIISVGGVNELPTDLSLDSTTISENAPIGTLVGLLSTTDPDETDTHVYTLVPGAGDADNASFTIVGNQLRVVVLLNFEAKSMCSIRLRTDDGHGGTYEETAVITVLDVNESPTALALAPATIAENSPIGTLVGLLSTTDEDTADAHTYMLVPGSGDEDNGLFTIVGNQLRVIALLNYETQTICRIRVRTDDGHGGTYEAAVFVSVTNVNESPTDISLSTTFVPENVPIGVFVAYLSAVDEDLTDWHTYSLVAGTGDVDNGLFAVVGDQLWAVTVFDFETRVTYGIRLGTNDGHGGTYEKEVTITVTDVNESPSDISLSGTTVVENSVAGTLVGVLGVSDPDLADTHTYTLVPGPGDTHNGLFAIVGTGLRTAAPLDFETQSACSIRVQVSDGKGGVYEKPFTIAVTNANESPTGLFLSNATISENSPVGTTVGTLTATDPDAGDTRTYALVSGTGDTDNGLFAVVGDELRTAAPLDFENKAVCSIRLQVVDSQGAVYQKTFTVTVTDLNESATDIVLSPASVAENSAVGSTVGTLTNNDPDTADTHTYTLVVGDGDTHNDLFEIVGNALLTATVIDFEIHPICTIRVQVDDGHGGVFAKVIAVTVTNVNEAPTDLSLAPSAIAENAGVGALVGMFSTTDPDLGDTHVHVLTPGPGDTDNALFVVVGNQLRALANFDYEMQNTYSIRVLTDDGHGETHQKSLTVAVTNVNEPPTALLISASTVVENAPAGTVVGTLAATDPESSDTHTYALVAGLGDTDNGLFAVVGDELRTSVSFNFEEQSARSIRLQADDGAGGIYQSAFTITVTDVNETPTDISLSSTSVAEGKPAGTIVAWLSTSDPDPADTHVYALVPGVGDADNGLFTIVGNELRSAVVFDFENQNSLSIRIQTDDGKGGVFEEAVIIGVVNENEMPTDITLAGAAVAENMPPGTLVGLLSTTDPDVTDSHTYSLVSGTGGDDNARFVIVDNELRTSTVLDFELAATLSVRIQTDDGHGGVFQKALTVTVSDVNEAPTALSLSNTAIPENCPIGTVVGLLSTVDQDVADVHTYTLAPGVGDAGNGLFTIVGNEMRTAVTFDFETGNSFSVRLQTDDGRGGIFQEALTISITDVNDAPVIEQGEGPLQVVMSEDGAPVAWSAPVVSATDLEGDPLTWFVLSPATHGAATVSGTGATPTVLSYVPAADYNGADAFVVGVSDGRGGVDSISVSVIVHPVNDAPAIAPIPPRIISELQPFEFVVQAEDVDGDSLTFEILNLPEGATFDAATHTFSWTPDRGDEGTYPGLLVRVLDDGIPPATSERTFTIIVLKENRAPMLEPIGDREVDEGQLLEFTISASDPDGHTVTFSARNLPPGATFDPFTRIFSWTPSMDAAGVYTGIEFLAMDDGLPPLSDSESIAIIVHDAGGEGEGEGESFPLTILSGPMIVYTTDTTALVAWTTNMPATSEVLYGEAGDSHEAQNAELATRHVVMLDGLEPDTRYWYEVRSEDTTGEPPIASERAWFRTLLDHDAAAPIITEGPLIKQVTDTAIVIRWTTDEWADSRVESGLSPTNLDCVSGGDLLEPVHRVVMGGLLPGTDYFFRVSSVDAVGNGPTSSSVFRVRTRAEQDTHAPIFVDPPAIVATTDTMAIVRWTTDEATTGTVNLVQAKSLEGTYADETVGSEHLVVLGGLEPNTQYALTCRAQDIAGNSVTSVMVSFGTNAAPDTNSPDFVEVPEVVSVSDTAILLAWTTNDLTDTYVVICDELGNIVNTYGQIDFTESHMVVLGNLQPDTVYYCHVFGSDVAGNAISRTYVTSVTTTEGHDQTPPQFVLGPLSEDVDRSSARIRWTTDDMASGQVAYGLDPDELFFFRAGSGDDSRVEQSVTLSGLTPATTYFYVVQITDFVGNSTVSDIMQFRTEGNEDDTATLALLIGLGGFGVVAAASGGGGGSGGGACFIATAAYGTPLAREIDVLRAFRDDVLLTSSAGTAFVDAYYRISPTLADVVARSPVLAALVRAFLIPIILTIKHPSVALALMLCVGLAMRTRHTARGGRT